MKKISYLLSAIVLTQCIISGCHSTAPKNDSTNTESIKVEVLTIEPQIVQTAKTYIGKITSSSSRTINAPFPATVENISVTQGEYIKAEKLLARLHSESVESAFESSKASLEQAEDGYRRINSVKDNGSIPEVKIVEIQTQLSQARAAYRTAHKAYEDCNVKAPIEGTVSAVYIDKGEDISLLQPMFEIVDLNNLEMEIEVSETEISDYKLGDTAYVKIPAISDKNMPAVLSKKGVCASTISHSYKCNLKLKDFEKGTMPGMMGKAVFINNYNKLPVIPTSIVRSEAEGKYVWVVNKNNIVEKRPVTTGDFCSNGISIINGLECGDRVICKGMSKVSSGMKVSIE
mgnify:CR=1 FL=1